MLNTTNPKIRLKKFKDWENSHEMVHYDKYFVGIVLPIDKIVGVKCTTILKKQVICCNKQSTQNLMPTDFLKLQVINYSVSSCTCKHEILDLWSITSDCFSKHSSAPLRTFVSSIQKKNLTSSPTHKRRKKTHLSVQFLCPKSTSAH